LDTVERSLSLINNWKNKHMKLLKALGSVGFISSVAACISIIGFLALKIPNAYAAGRNGSVKLCNGDVREETVTAAIMYYSFEKNGWVAQGWYNIAPGKYTYITDYRGGIFLYEKTPSSVYSGSGNTGFCGPVSAGFYGYQKSTCKRNERFYRGIEIAVPENGGGYRFTFGNPQLIRDDF
jgi:hypothetical protein